jgi:DNA-binding CsgD family transcriptional regulator
MNKATTMDTRSERMLELLAQGASARVLAEQLGYSEGTMRVYLHNLYRAIGVRNKTEAVIWYMNRTREESPLPPPRAAAPDGAPPPPSIPVGHGFGEMALAEDLYTALGAMGSFVGPYGYLWEAGLKLKGVAIDAKLTAQRAQSRLLWRALLKGDFAYAKMLYDDGAAARIAAESPTDGAMIACLLTLGGFSTAAQKIAASLAEKGRSAAAGKATAPGREMALVRAVSQAAEGNESGTAALYEAASEKGRAPALKQLAMATLFQVYRVRKELDAARQTADALWAEAEATRQQLEAMGVRPLSREAALPPVGAGEQAVAALRKAALAR